MVRVVFLEPSNDQPDMPIQALGEKSLTKIKRRPGGNLYVFSGAIYCAFATSMEVDSPLCVARCCKEGI